MFSSVVRKPFQRAFAARDAAATLDLLANLSAWWELDEASGTRNDSHTNALHLTDNNTVTQAVGVGGVGNAAQFTSANGEWLSRASEANLQLGGGDFTIAGWVYLDSKAAAKYIASKWGSSAGQFEWYLLYDNGADRFTFHVRKADDTGGSSTTANNLGSPSTATWYFIVCRHYNAADLIGISVNAGTENTAAYASTGPPAGGTNFTIGRLGGSATNLLDGRVQYFGLWKGLALSDAQVTALYNGGAGVTYEQLS